MSEPDFFACPSKVVLVSLYKLDNDVKLNKDTLKYHVFRAKQLLPKEKMEGILDDFDFEITARGPECHSLDHTFSMLHLSRMIDLIPSNDCFDIQLILTDKAKTFVKDELISFIDTNHKSEAFELLVDKIKHINTDEKGILKDLYCPFETTS